MSKNMTEEELQQFLDDEREEIIKNDSYDDNESCGYRSLSDELRDVGMSMSDFV